MLCVRVFFPVVYSALFRQTAVSAGWAAHGDEELQSGGAGRQQPLQDKTPLDKGETQFWNGSAEQN